MLGLTIYDKGHGLGVHAQGSQCESNHFPVYAGGSGNERVNCFAYDEDNELLIVGGVTNSEDFGPAANDHGFLFALDLESNWVWGNFFYNVSYAVSNITGCKISPRGDALSVMAIGNSLPVYMEINTLSGDVQNFVTLDTPIRTDEYYPLFEAQAGVFDDVEDPTDGQAYTYMSFVMDYRIHMLRMQSDTAEIDYQYELQSETGGESDKTSFLFPCTKSKTSFYWAGSFENYGSIMRLNKQDHSLVWRTDFPSMSDINSVQAQDDLLLCGNHESDSGTAAAVVKMGFNGETSFYLKISGTSTLSDGEAHHEECRGLARGTDDSFAVALTTLSPEDGLIEGPSTDILLIVFNSDGSVRQSVTITQNDSFYLSQGALLASDDVYYFSGYSTGFDTKLQQQRKPDMDAFVYRYDFENSEEDCLFKTDNTQNSVERMVQYSDGNRALSANLVKRPRQSLLMTSGSNYTAYTSRYSGGFQLMSAIQSPRPCAYRSENMPQIQYYRGQDSFFMGLKTIAFETYSLLSTSAEVYFSDGSLSDSLVSYDYGRNRIEVFTAEEDMIGVHHMTLRDCDTFDRLIEVNINVDVLPNTYPSAVSEIETSFTVAVGEVINYKLPDFIDPEGNDEPEVYISVMNGQEDQYPPFLRFENSTNTIVIAPESQNVQGRTYYFTLVTKESNSDFVSYSYYMTINVSGDIIEEVEPSSEATVALTSIPFSEHFSEMSSYQINLESWLALQWYSDYYTGSYCGYSVNTDEYASDWSGNPIEGMTEDVTTAFFIGHDCQDWDLSVRVVMSGMTARKIIAFSVKAYDRSSHAVCEELADDFVACNFDINLSFNGIGILFDGTDITVWHSVEWHWRPTWFFGLFD